MGQVKGYELTALLTGVFKMAYDKAENTVTSLRQMVYGAVTNTLRLGFGQRPVQATKKTTLADLRKVPTLSSGGFWNNYTTHHHVADDTR